MISSRNRVFKDEFLEYGFSPQYPALPRDNHRVSQYKSKVEYSDFASSHNWRNSLVVSGWALIKLMILVTSFINCSRSGSNAFTTNACRCSMQCVLDFLSSLGRQIPCLSQPWLELRRWKLQCNQSSANRHLAM